MRNEIPSPDRGTVEVGVQMKLYRLRYILSRSHPNKHKIKNKPKFDNVLQMTYKAVNDLDDPYGMITSRLNVSMICQYNLKI